MQKNKILLVLLVFLYSGIQAQDLEAIVEADSSNHTDKEYVSATFKSTKIINGHSTETPGKRILQFLIQHRFGTIDNGLYDLFGLDNATIRLGLDYGINSRIAVGIGRSSMYKAVDGYIKAKLLRQVKNGMPVTMTLLTCAAINTVKWSDKTISYKFAHRMNYTTQLLISKKISKALSLQIMPTWVHINLTSGAGELNDVFALGVGGRIKVTRSFALTSEYYINDPARIDTTSRNPISFGIDIETGGHVFQLHFTNCVGIIENQFITKTSDNWLDTKFRFGFNISRVFTIGKRK